MSLSCFFTRFLIHCLAKGTAFFFLELYRHATRNFRGQGPGNKKGTIEILLNRDIVWKFILQIWRRKMYLKGVHHFATFIHLFVTLNSVTTTCLALTRISYYFISKRKLYISLEKAHLHFFAPKGRVWTPRPPP